jgi:hypothetical protein
LHLEVEEGGKSLVGFKGKVIEMNRLIELPQALKDNIASSPPSDH